jgi:hypothetical protein
VSGGVILTDDQARDPDPLHTTLLRSSELVHLQRQSVTRPLAHRLICGTDMRSSGDAWVTEASDERDAINCPRCLAILYREAKAVA